MLRCEFYNEICLIIHRSLLHTCTLEKLNFQSAIKSMAYSGGGTQIGAGIKTGSALFARSSRLVVYLPCINSFWIAMFVHEFNLILNAKNAWIYKTS